MRRAVWPAFRHLGASIGLVEGKPISTRGVVFRGPGAQPRIEELSLDPPQRGEVQVRMAAAGVCHSDLHVVDGEWERPAGVVMGHEGAACVEEIGDGVTGLEVGDLVVLAWTAPCASCASCRRGEPWLCTRPDGSGHRLAPELVRLHDRSGGPVGAYSGIGTFGERQVVAASAAIKVDPRTPPEIAALIGCAVTTGIGAVRNTANVTSRGVRGRDRCRRSWPERHHRSRRAGRGVGDRHRQLAGEARARHAGRRPSGAARERGRSGQRGRSRARVHRPRRDRRARDRSCATGWHGHARRHDAPGATGELRCLPIR